MPERGCKERFDYTPNFEEDKIIKELFNEEYDIPENFVETTRVFNPLTDNIERDLKNVPQPEAQVNPQTELFCEKLGIDDPIGLTYQKSGSFGSSYLSAGNDANMTYEITKNVDEIELDDDPRAKITFQLQRSFHQATTNQKCYFK